jgi:hypothetical protein
MKPENLLDNTMSAKEIKEMGKTLKNHERCAKSVLQLDVAQKSYNGSKADLAKHVRSFSASEIREKMDNMQKNFNMEKDLNKFSQNLNVNETQRLGYAFTVSAITGKIIPAAYRAMRNKEIDA